ncbi:hypothetical protein DRN69_03670 [Candidatus Pacearchaeota archaeon]|nr:MAG: hypothetical protein DRN69_03670 [Candidatus Pacearchaeota archaeon]
MGITEMKNFEEKNFLVVLLAVIFNPENRKILIGKRKDPYIEKLTWTFPGGKAEPGDELESVLKRKIKEKTGLKVENLGSIFARVPPEKKDLVLIYYLCEAIEGEEKATGDLTELKWVKPEEIEKFFTTSFHPYLKEYILNLKKSE